MINFFQYWHVWIYWNIHNIFQYNIKTNMVDIRKSTRFLRSTYNCTLSLLLTLVSKCNILDYLSVSWWSSKKMRAGGVQVSSVGLPPTEDLTRWYRRLTDDFYFALISNKDFRKSALVQPRELPEVYRAGDWTTFPGNRG